LWLEHDAREESPRRKKKKRRTEHNQPPDGSTWVQDVLAYVSTFDLLRCCLRNVGFFGGESLDDELMPLKSCARGFGRFYENAKCGSFLSAAPWEWFADHIFPECEAFNIKLNSCSLSKEDVDKLSVEGREGLEMDRILLRNVSKALHVWCF